MSYFEFLRQWYNWPYIAALTVVFSSLAYRPFLSGWGTNLGMRLGLERTPGYSVLRTFGTALAVIGLTLNGALHDYLPGSQRIGFLAGLVISVLIAGLLTRRIGRYRERHFPRIKAVGLGSHGLSGLEGRVVSQSVGPDYLAGRAQVMDSEETLHMVMCKTAEEEILHGSRIVLGEYDATDGRYFVERV